MAAFLLRCSLPDRPGALGLVASRIGAVRGDIVSISVRRRFADSVIDEFVVELPDEVAVRLLEAEVMQVDGVILQSCEPLAVDPDDEGRHGLVWMELLVDDLDAATTYYRDALGWSSEPFGLLGGDGYRLLTPSGGEPPVGGLVRNESATRTSRCAGPVPYVEVLDLEAVCERVRSAGGQVRVAPNPLDEVGRFAIVADPWGNRLGLWASSD
jgi:predicted enzyme related to lactoylglutathione lyase